MTDTAGTLLRDWRRRRNLSQLDLAHRAEVSTRHLSFIETGRARPTSQMILRLCDQLAVPLREQNRLLLASGFAPAHPEHTLADPPMAEVNAALEAILAAHLPFPALVVDPGWELVAANDAIWTLLEGIPADLLEPPVNVIRLSLHPRGLAPRIVNLAEWREHLVQRLRREYDASADARIKALLEEVAGPGAPGLDTVAAQPAGPIWAARPTSAAGSAALVVPLQLRAGDDILSFISTTTVFGTPREVTLSELAIEAFYPADQQTRAALGVTAER